MSIITFIPSRGAISSGLSGRSSIVRELESRPSGLRGLDSRPSGLRGPDRNPSGLRSSESSQNRGRWGRSSIIKGWSHRSSSRRRSASTEWRDSYSCWRAICCFRFPGLFDSVFQSWWFCLAVPFLFALIFYGKISCLQK